MLMHFLQIKVICPAKEVQQIHIHEFNVIEDSVYANIIHQTQEATTQEVETAFTAIEKNKIKKLQYLAQCFKNGGWMIIIA